MRQVRNLYPNKKDKKHNDARHEPECFAMSQSKDHLVTLADCFAKNKLLLGPFATSFTQKSTHHQRPVQWLKSLMIL